jgi:hypothetical protein
MSWPFLCWMASGCFVDGIHFVFTYYFPIVLFDCYPCLVAIHLKQWWSTMPPISTKQPEAIQHKKGHDICMLFFMCAYYWCSYSLEEDWNPINWFNSATFLCLSAARTWIYKVICHGLSCVERCRIYLPFRSTWVHSWFNEVRVAQSLASSVFCKSLSVFL